MVSDRASERAYDLVLFGATGFTGGLTAEYLAGHAPEGCRWAVAGRNRAKLEALRDRLGLPELPVLVADSADADALAEVARSARVVVTTVGPYQRHGEPLVRACAEAGTDYVDLTGEPEFVDTMYTRYHARAVASGARMLHACGFDSVPHDLGVLFTVDELARAAGREELDGPVAVEGYVRVSGTFSGGTFASTLTAFSRPVQMGQAAKARRAVEERTVGRRQRGAAVGPRWSKDAHAWAVPMPAIDQQIVLRSAAALPVYGPDFRYGHYAAVKRLPIALAGIAGVVGVALGAQIPPLRRKLEQLRPSGAGPDAAQRARSWFTVRFSGAADGRHIWTEVSGGDPGYGETAKMLAETALCLAYDDLPKTAGQQTTASACGAALIGRLRAAGIAFRVLESRPTAAPGRFRG
ncbi:saccharopine dehydrogenase family protein [Streptacidiphilus anmyonensis]|uniref:saccharopine dehydrogenase family protein n=1 Tax=Streptacidiphilus anmyonensis TaxID=405782 RepID=UPI0005A97186|nr:saccharopine dehydrogenase NADP-binding domain-containing protein [Streptacidiphilus anmyonensis]